VIANAHHDEVAEHQGRQMVQDRRRLIDEAMRSDDSHELLRRERTQLSPQRGLALFIERKRIEQHGVAFSSFETLQTIGPCIRLSAGMDE
jgi:hypothetical protein